MDRAVYNENLRLRERIEELEALLVWADSYLRDEETAGFVDYDLLDAINEALTGAVKADSNLRALLTSIYNHVIHLRAAEAARAARKE